MEHLEVRDSPGKGLFLTKTYGFDRETYQLFVVI